ncbi:MAG: PilC/PilY family type IV pilus protein [Rhodocyclaceae bacterium]
MEKTLNQARWAGFLGAALLLVTPGAFPASSLTISTTPLGSGAGISVKPNMLFILDDSGSMASDYTPDYVNDSVCPSNVAAPGSTYSCELGDVLYNAPGFNSQYYNPAIRYLPPKDASGTEWTNASTSATKVNPFLSSTTKDLTSTYLNRYWCQNSSDDPTGATAANCRQNTTLPATGYSYPDGTYTNAKTKSNGNPYYYTLSGQPSWCSNKALTTCQSKRTSTFKYPKLAAAASTTGVAAYRTFYVLQAGNTSGSKTIDISYNGSVIASFSKSYSTNSKNNRNDLADQVVASINGGGTFTATLLVSDTSTGGSACGDSNTGKCAQVKVTAPGGATSTSNTDYNGKNFNLSQPTGIDFKDGTATFGTTGVNYLAAASGVAVGRVDIVPATTSYPKGSARADCAGATCNYAEELQNFANWYSFYRTRMQMMKTAISRSYASLSDTAPSSGYRVGLTFISSGASSAEISSSGDSACWTTNKALQLPIADFNVAQKTAFYTNLFAVATCSWTPLRGALSRAGQVYAGVSTLTGASDPDPVQYSCQQNFTFLSTDGYWNSDIEDSSYGPKDTSGNDVGDQDGSATSYQKDAQAKSNTLADVALYYYSTDLRPAMTDDVPVSAKDQISKQHMVTFTMGLGVDGALTYSSDYESGGSADYTAIGQGTKDWGDPIANSTDARIDDLWHAAVNGRGKYFSAADPVQVVSSLEESLLGMTAMTGSSAAAATSNLEPVAGDNYAYVASYVTQTWEGNIEARVIDLATGELGTTAVWSAQALLDAKAARTLYGFDSAIAGTDKKFSLTWANAQAKGWDGSVSGKDYFNPVQVPQCATISNCPGATKANLFSYLMGGADSTSNGSYRARAHVLGDIVSTQPVYVKKPSFGYTDSGYDTFKTSTRKAMVYVGANDGFLHAFDANSGEEDWAFMPSAVLPNLHDLASTSYAHRYLVDGVLTVGDVLVGSTWKTVLVGGLNSGGNAYYALDVTDPTAPIALWEFSDGRMGNSFGNPLITKLPTGATSSSGANIAGKWVAIVTSGYNNGGTAFADHNGEGIVYVLDAYTGVEYFRIYTCTTQASAATCSGSSASPAGLAKINGWVATPTTDNTTLYVYGGDLDGNLWRFDIAGKSAFKVAEVGEPITVKPELASVEDNKVVFFGTGLFLQGTDKNDASRRSVYAIKDDLAAASALTSVKTSGALVQQTLSLKSGSTTQRTVAAPATVDWAVKSGWFVELLEDGERVNIDPKIQLGTLIVASNVPDTGSSNACTSGGHAWINLLDIKTGSFVVNEQSNVGHTAGYKVSNALVVGVNVIKLPNGKLVVIATTSDNKHPIQEAPVSSANLPMKRVSWRELISE